MFPTKYVKVELGDRSVYTERCFSSLEAFNTAYRNTSLFKEGSWYRRSVSDRYLYNRKICVYLAFGEGWSLSEIQYVEEMAKGVW